MRPHSRRRWLFTAAAAGAFFAGCAAETLWTFADDPPKEEWHVPSRAARRKNPIAADDKSVAAGKAVYAAQCVSCHGAAGKGDGPAAKDINPRPHDLSDPAILAQSDGALFYKVSTGKKPMPAFEKLTGEEERWNVVNYIRTFGASAGGGDGNKPK